MKNLIKGGDFYGSLKVYFGIASRSATNKTLSRLFRNENS